MNRKKKKKKKMFMDTTFGDLPVRLVEIKQKQISEIFKEHNLSMSININLTTINFWWSISDDLFDLKSDAPRPCQKTNDAQIYIQAFLIIQNIW